MQSSELSVVPLATNPAESRRVPITAAYYIVFIALGLTVAALGPTLGRLARNTGVDATSISVLFPARSFGYLLGSLLGGYLYDRVRGHPVMAAMLILMAVGLALIPSISFLWVLVIAMLAVGLVEGTTDVGGNVLLVWLHRDKVGPYMNALHFMFGIGAFISPLIIAQSLSRTDDITWGYWILAILVFPISLWLIRLPSPARPVAKQDEPIRQGNNILIFMIAVFFFLFVAAEGSFGGWIATYALVGGLTNEVDAARLTSAFWGALTVGRLLSIPIAFRFSVQTILLVDAVGCVISLAMILLWPHSLVVTWVGTLGFGLFMASMFPASISLAERSMTVTGRTTSWFLVGAASGGMTIPWIIGQVFGVVGWQGIMWVLVIVMIIALGLYFVLTSYVKRQL